MNKNLKKILIVLVVLFILVAAASGALWGLNKPLDRNDTTYKYVRIEQGSTTSDIASKLQKEGIIKSGKNYKILSKIWRYDGKYQAGTYSLSPSMTSNAIAKELTSGKVSSNNFTIIEGSTVTQITDVLVDQGIVDRAKFEDVLANGDFSNFSFLEGAPSGAERLEGFLFPDTYQIDIGASEEQIVTTMLNQFDKVYTDKDRKRAKELGMSDRDVIIVASLIEKEAQVDKDRPKVASVIYNRLKIDMPLQFCSTVNFVLGKNAKEALTIADTQTESPYNTYLHNGLPPGPICCPGKKSIEAALYPAKSDYLYFVVSDKMDGTNKFSSTEEQFEKDKAAYNKAYDASLKKKK